ncbi:hypothetical protein Misp01_75190 [Microtetraspora sp. NBRC 13810]|uniref:alpha/beta hydrolase n=1 Tax=Microtetraspora sp. NBRC 13810 TaxID=3030990 RepID=UPI0024A478E5|nr:alpha/beta hydrolase [Microtetraspora sp. NBRC 13810]GLW12391.1 hypothetical protein Misp01_75190 [Microtetraspora sp. NBRC 13810]
MEDIAFVLWLHGGGWRGRSAENGGALAEHGLIVLEGSYRLTDEAHWPAQLEDAREATRRARTRAHGRPLIVAGDSAGAHLALHVGLRGIDEPGDVDAVMAFWPPVDPLADDWLQARKDDDIWESLIGHPPAPGDAATVDSTPLTHVGSGVPVLLVHGAQDDRVPVTQTTAMSSALLATGHPVHTLITHGGHGLDLRRDDIAAIVRAFLSVTFPARYPRG